MCNFGFLKFLFLRLSTLYSKIFFVDFGLLSLSVLDFIYSVYAYFSSIQLSDNCALSTPAEKALIEHAFELRAELENAASDVSGLFDKIGWL